MSPFLVVCLDLANCSYPYAPVVVYGSSVVGEVIVFGVIGNLVAQVRQNDVILKTAHEGKEGGKKGIPRYASRQSISPVTRKLVKLLKFCHREVMQDVLKRNHGDGNRWELVSTDWGRSCYIQVRPSIYYGYLWLGSRPMLGKDLADAVIAIHVTVSYSGTKQLARVMARR